MTIYDFAKAIGVSATTVSRTLSGSGRVSPATRKMVLEQMVTLGYTPNTTAQRLVKGRTYTVLLDCGEIPPFADMFTLEIVRGVQRALARHGYALLLNAPNGTPLETVVGGAVDGAILVGDDASVAPDASATANLARQMAERGRPVVLIGHRPVIYPHIGSVALDLQSGVREAARFLVAQGHRRIGFIASRLNDSVFQPFAEELKKLSVPLADEMVALAGRTVEDGERGMMELLSRPARPTAVFARNDTLGAGALRGARRMKLQVPEDVAIIGHDDLPFATLLEPALATVRVDAARLGETATDLLLKLFDDWDQELTPEIISTTFVPRDSVIARNSEPNLSE